VRKYGGGFPLTLVSGKTVVRGGLTVRIWYSTDQIKQRRAGVRRTASAGRAGWLLGDIPARCFSLETTMSAILYHGQPCGTCGNSMRYVSSRDCVNCAARRDRERVRVFTPAQRAHRAEAERRRRVVARQHIRRAA
jgi:hypothetical protein